MSPRTFAREVPARWRSFEITKQGDDYSCGLHCIAAAARHLDGVPARRDPVREVLKALSQRTRAGVERKVATPNGLSERDLRSLAGAAGLGLYRPNGQGLDQFKESGWMWIALVRFTFTEPAGRRDSYEAPHYVLVLDHDVDRGDLVLADPHPWKPNVYTMGLATFDVAWRSARRGRAPWAACVSKQ